MIRIKLFALFIAFALLALVRPRKCLELLEAADAGAKQKPVMLSESEMATFKERLAWSAVHWAEHVGARETPEGEVVFGSWMAVRAMLIQRRQHSAREALGVVNRDECPLPPAGWRCTRRAGHDGPCAAVEVDPGGVFGADAPPQPWPRG